MAKIIKKPGNATSFLQVELTVEIYGSKYTLKLHPSGHYKIYNKYSTPVTLLKCESCKHVFTVCLAVEESNLDNWRGCLGVGCESYDESRDIDKVWGEAQLFGLIKQSKIDEG